ncbi:MAG: hypothetical protein N2749_02035, partial [Clostridia bacterium]|nr:hypothetical protein [Clostridia bacterium]
SSATFRVFIQPLRFCSKKYAYFFNLFIRDCINSEIVTLGENVIDAYVDMHNIADMYWEFS